jgi:hypothetical protein
VNAPSVASLSRIESKQLLFHLSYVRGKVSNPQAAFLANEIRNSHRNKSHGQKKILFPDLERGALSRHGRVIV